MMISKKQWLDSWTNCHIIHISKKRSFETGNNEKYTGIESHLSITRVPIYGTKICKDVDMGEFCHHCLRCKRSK